MATTLWSHKQRKRLAIEKNLLETHFPGRTVWIDRTNANKTKLEIALNTNDNSQFVLRVYLEEDFPHSCPVLVVRSPKLRLKNGDRFPESGTEFHTLEDVDGYPSICHFMPGRWTEENTLYQVVVTGRLWLEAYTLYRRTGKTMDNFLKEF